MKPEQSKQIEQLYLEMFELLFTYARSSLKNDALAEEAVQETFRIACLKPAELYDCPNPRGWLLTTLKNVLRNTKKAQKYAQQLLIEYTAVHGSDAAFVEDHLRLEISYANLVKREEFQLLKEWAVEGKSHLELANERGITLTACKKRIQRAKELLKKKI